MPLLRPSSIKAVPSEPFYVVYRGPQVEDGTIPVRALAPSLLALGALMEQVHEIAHPGEPPISLDIRASPERGSFIIDLAVQSSDEAGVVRSLIPLFAGPAVTAAVNLLALVTTPVSGVVGFIKWMKGRRVESAVPVDAGAVRITTEDGDSITIPNEVYEASDSVAVRKYVREFVAPVEQPGISEVAIGTGARNRERTLEVVVTKQDLSAFTITPATISTGVPIGHADRIVSVVSPNFRGGKWRVSEGNGSFWVTITDPVFKQRVEQGEAFAKGDFLRVEMTTGYSLVDGNLHPDHQVTRVVEHVSRPEQGRLFGGTP
jgi:hypothetical protein